MATIKKTISVAGIEIEFCASERDSQLLDQRYSPFYSCKDGLADATVELDLYDPPEDAWSGETLSISEAGNYFTLRSHGLRATIAQDGSTARLRAPRLERCLDAVLRYILSKRLLLGGGLLLHASAIVRNEQAWVFAGPSGVGKTTISKQLGGWVLGDEAIALKMHKGKLMAYATPYWRAKPGSAPVTALVFPVQGTKNWCEHLSVAHGLGKLMSCVGPLLPNDDRQVMITGASMVATKTTNLLHVSLESIAAIRNWLQPTILGFPETLSLIE